MHIMRVLDRKLVERLWNLRPHRSVLSLDSPHAPSGVFKAQSPQTLTIQNFLYGGTSEFNTL